MKRSNEYVNQLVEQAQHEQSGRLVCRAHDCDRSFLDVATLTEHAEAVHTFEDIRRMVAEVCRDKYGRRGDYEADPIVPTVWVWIEDLADDWVVFMVEEGNSSDLFKASYEISPEGVVTLGEPLQVRRRTVYDATPA